MFGKTRHRKEIVFTCTNNSDVIKISDSERAWRLDDDFIIDLGSVVLGPADRRAVGPLVDEDSDPRSDNRCILV